MPGTNAGTGNPLTFRCARCKVGDYRNRERGTRWEVTGDRREHRKHSAGPRMDHIYEYGYQCKDCGHRGWSRHTWVKDAWEGKGGAKAA